VTASRQGERTMRPSRGRMKNAAPIAAGTTMTIGTRSRLTGDQPAGRKPKLPSFDCPVVESTYVMKAFAALEFVEPLTATMG
jgi:hypothetical protein